VVGIEVDSAGDMAGAIAVDTVVDGVVASSGVTISCVGRLQQHYHCRGGDRQRC
jgi:hypothetical protein